MAQDEGTTRPERLDDTRCTSDVHLCHETRSLLVSPESIVAKEDEEGKTNLVRV